MMVIDKDEDIDFDNGWADDLAVPSQGLYLAYGRAANTSARDAISSAWYIFRGNI